MRTTDGGNSWSKVGDLAFGQIQFVNDTMGFGRTTGYYGRIYKTTDAGKNWVMKFQIDEDVNSMDFVDENVGYITGDQGLMFKTDHDLWHPRHRNIKFQCFPVWQLWQDPERTGNRKYGHN